MNEAPAPPTDAAPSGRVPTGRRHRARHPWTRRIGWTLGALAGLGLAGVFSLRLWVERYLKSETFTQQLNATAGRTLESTCLIEGLSWQDSAAYAGTFTANGLEQAAFRRLTLSDIRAEVDAGAIWDRVWRVPLVKIAQVTADFSAGGRAPAPVPQADPATASGAAAKPGGWRERWLPNRSELGPIRVDRFDFTRKAGQGVPFLEGRGFSLLLKPNLKLGSLEIEGRDGEAQLENMAHPLRVSRLRTTLRPDEAAIDHLEGTLENAVLTAEGTIGLNTPGNLRLNVRLAGASLEQWLPEDWLKRCSGVASAKATVRGNWRLPETVQATGDFQVKDAMLQALPLLDIISKKTQNASFLRMQIKEATGRFERRQADDWQIRQLRADAPGLLRLKGAVDVTKGGTLQGSLLLGIVPGTLRYVAGAEQTVFLTADRFTAAAGNAGALSPDDTGLLWTRFQLTGTLEEPQEDLSERLAQAWFNATVEEVLALPMEAAATAARAAAGAANTLLEVAPPVLEKAPEVINQGVQGGLKLLDTLIPR